MNGIINLYKPPGITSHTAVAKIRRILQIKKVGHTGTLDPDAEGVLPICIGKGTKVSGMLTDTDKSYRAVIRFGIVTDTQDMGGQILSQYDAAITRQQLEQVLTRFTGEIQQVPPMYSAIKIGGKKLIRAGAPGQGSRSPAPHHHNIGIEVAGLRRPSRDDRGKLLQRNIYSDAVP